MEKWYPELQGFHVPIVLVGNAYIDKCPAIITAIHHPNHPRQMSHAFLGEFAHTHTGTKSDLHPTVSSAEAERVRRQLNANAYLECSAKQFANINEVIHAAVRAVGDGVPVPEEPAGVSCWNSFLDWFRC